MIRRLLAILLLFAALPLSPLLAQPPAPTPSPAATAQAAYDDGDLQTALATYHALLDAHSANHTPAPAALHYNLANTYYRLADLPRAIQHYLAAQRRAPRDPDIAANLQLALQSANVAPPPAPNAFLAPIRHLSPAEWTLLATSFYALLLLLLLIYLILPARLSLRQALLKPVVPLLLLAIVSTICRLTFLLPSYTRLAVLNNPGAPLLSAPLADATQLTHLPPCTLLYAPPASPLAYPPVLLPPSTHGYLPPSLLLPIP